MSYTKKMTEGSELKHIILFTLPLFAGNVFQQLYNIVDSIIVGKYLGANKLAAVGTTGSLTYLFSTLCIGLSVGAGILISQRFGAGMHKEVRKLITNSAYVIIAFGAVITVISVAFAGLLMKMMNTPENLLEDATAYMRAACSGTICVAAYNWINSVMRSLGDSRTPLIFLVVASLLNVGLDLLFILAFHWGVAGAAIATVAAQLISTFACFFYAFSKYPQLRLGREDWRITWRDVSRHLIQGVPLGLQFSVLSIGIIVMQGVVVQFDILDGVMVSNAAQNGFGAAHKLNNLLMTPFNGLGSAMTSFAAQNLGAGDYARIRKGTLQALIIAAVITAVMVGTGLLLTINGAYLHIFLSADKVTPETIRYGNAYLHIDLAMYPFLAFIFVMRNCVQGIGRPQFILGAGTAELVARVTVCLLLPPAIAGGAVSAAAPMLAFYAMCAADPVAWMSADAVLSVPFIRNILRSDYRYFYRLDKSDL